MRGFRGLILLVVVALPLFWFTYRESKKDPAADTGDKRDKVFSIGADAIEELEIKSEAGDQTTLQRKGGAWAIVQPAVAALPDEAVVSGITSNLASMEMQRVIDENPSDVAQFGLAAPRVEVAFKAAGQQKRLQIGQKTPSGTDVYARVADQKRVFLVSSFLESTFNKSAFDLQDKAVLKVDREKVDTLSISAAGRATSFAKANGEWMIKTPVDSRAEFTAVDGLVSRLGGLQMKSIAAGPAPSGNYGLDKPAATVRIGSGSSQATLVVGTAAADGAVYARDLSRPTVFTIESSLLDELRKDPSEYRQKDLFDARAFNTKKLEVTRAGQTSAFEKATAKDKDGKDVETWRQTAPSARTVDAATIEALISAATGARATSFAPAGVKTGLDTPELSVALEYDENRTERVAFVRTGGSVYAARQGSAGAAVIDAAVLDAIVKALEAVK